LEAVALKQVQVVVVQVVAVEVVLDKLVVFHNNNYPNNLVHISLDSLGDITLHDVLWVLDVDGVAGYIWKSNNLGHMMVNRFFYTLDDIFYFQSLL